MNVNRPDEGG